MKKLLTSTRRRAGRANDQSGDTAPGRAPRRAVGERLNKRLALGVFVVLGLGEMAVALRYSVVLGALLFVSTGALLLFARWGVALALAGQDDAPEARHPLEEPGHDRESGLPGRQQIIDQLVRDIARTERYQHALTLSVIEISQLSELESLWGRGTTTRAIAQVSETLQRITRTSDFLACLDRGRFAVVLLQCDVEQAKLFADRATLAVGNRPLPAREGTRLPLYVGIQVSALQFERSRFRGPLDFLSAAGGDMVPDGVVAPNARRPAADSQSLRRQLVRDYYPAGEAADFATAYRAAREQGRKTG
ncbi:MAG: diguanylate cyclase [Chloroflexi bacterium]|nr:diguanylate cyclase [Chloroflexota bacterium]